MDEHNDSQKRGGTGFSRGFGRKAKFVRRKARNWLGYIFGKVSSVHYQAAHERYWILWRELEEKLYNSFFELNLAFVEIDKDKVRSDDDIDQHIHALKKEVAQKAKGEHCTTAKHCLSLINHYKVLAKDRNLLTRHEKHLCTLWQDMTFIRIRLFRDFNSGGSELASYLDFCREEARNLKVQDVPEIKETLHEAAVELAGPTDNGQAEQAKDDHVNIRTVRALSTILIRLNAIRLHRIHSQLKTKNAYQWALLFLLPLALILIFSNDFVLNVPGDKKFEYVPVAFNSSGAVELGLLRHILAGLIQPVYMAGNWAAGLMASNPIFFIFVAGLMGGFLSTVMKLRTPEGLPGEDAFFKWYVLTKPFVGALAAAILYVIVHTGVVHLDIQKVDLITGIVEGPIGAAGFSFGFLMGFSERIIMPQLN